jgi:hypothetical protein
MLIQQTSQALLLRICAVPVRASPSSFTARPLFAPTVLTGDVMHAMTVVVAYRGVYAVHASCTAGRAITPQHGQIVCAIVDNYFTVRCR